MRTLAALCAGLNILVATPTEAAQKSLPPVPYYDLLAPPSFQPAAPPRNTEKASQTQYKADTGDPERNLYEAFWERLARIWDKTTDDPVAFFTFWLACFTFVLAFSTIGLWIVTWRSGLRQSRETRASTKAAEDAVAASLAALSHARETAERDFRPWLTVNAKLISPVAVEQMYREGYSEEKGVAFFIELTCRNVGKVAAVNVIYGVSGIDIGDKIGADAWFQDLIDVSVHACKFAGPQSWSPKHSLECSSDALAPSEEYKAKRWCRIAPLKPDSIWRSVPKEQRIHQICVGIVAAYSSVSADGPIFYTAKVLPIGKINLPEFLGLIGATELPIDIDEVGIGPTYKAIAT